MQDRFKFRCFNKFQDKMFDVKSISYVDGIVKRIEVQGDERILIFDEWMGNIDNTVLMQCTGLKDKNGKLIYENDIVFNNYNQWIIKYCDRCKYFQCFDNTYGCFACEGDYNWYDFLEDLDEITVIGNIYENPEILEDNNKMTFLSEKYITFDEPSKVTVVRYKL